VLGGGASVNDLVSLIDADDYFRGREISTSIDNLKELAGKDPKDARAQVAQLLAIRLLGELKIGNVDEKQRIAAALAPVAAGTRAQDRAGFAKQYALRAVARLSGKAVAEAPAAPGGGVSAPLAWFPKEATFVGAFDAAGAAGLAGGEAELRDTL